LYRSAANPSTDAVKKACKKQKKKNLDETAVFPLFLQCYITTKRVKIQDLFAGRGGGMLIETEEMSRMEETRLPEVLRRMEESLRGELRACNALSARFGLTLSEEAMQAVARRRVAALRETGRVEFGKSAVPKLIEAFCDSPYLLQEEYEETLGELTDAFYALKNDSMGQVSDDELIEKMRACYDAYEGGLDAVIGLTLSAILRGRRLDDAEEEADE